MTAWPDGGLPSPEEARKAVESAVLAVWDRAPIWSSHLLTLRRPNLGAVAQLLNESLLEADGDLCALAPDDVFVLVRVAGFPAFDVAATLESEAVIAGDEIGYSTRFDLYGADFEVVDALRITRHVCSTFGLLDFGDSVAIDRSGLDERSRSAFRRYAEDPARELPAFLVSRGGLESRRRRQAAAELCTGLIPFGAVMPAAPGWIAEVTGVAVPRDRLCAVALPPASDPPRPPRVMLDWDEAEGDPTAFPEDFLGFLTDLPAPAPPWLGNDGYRLPKLGDAARRFASRIQFMPEGGVRRSASRGEFVAASFELADEPGWDLHSPVKPAPAVAPSIAPAPVAEESRPADDPAPAERPSPPTRARASWAADAYPDDLAQLADWAAGRLPRHLVLTPRALRAARHVRHPEPERIARALELLANARYDAFMGRRERREEFVRALQALHLRDGFSNAERLAGRTGDDYLCAYEGRTLLLDRHLRSNASPFNDPRLIRIYYTFDPLTEAIVVGWLPTHLMTTQS